MRKSLSINTFTFLAFLFSPFICLLISIKNYKNSWARNVWWAFIVFYGFNFVIYDEMMDSDRYAENLVTLNQADINFENFFSLFLTSEESAYLDIISPMLTFIVSRFTDNFSILFAVYAFVFGFFYTRNIQFLLDRSEAVKTYSGLVLFGVITLLIPFWSINGFRFWTASHVFIFGMLPYLFLERNIKYVLIACISVLFHFSFIVPVLFVFLSRFFKPNLLILYYLYLVSFFMGSIQLQPIQQFISDLTPSFLHSKLQTYVNDDYAQVVQATQDSAKWFVFLQSEGIKYLIFCLISVFFFVYIRLIKSNKLFFEIFAFILYFSIFNNFISIIPSVGRFQLINYYLLLSFVFILIGNQGIELKWIRRAIILFTPLIFLFIIYKFRIGFQTINILTIIGNPFLSINEPGQAILDFIK